MDGWMGAALVCREQGRGDHNGVAGHQQQHVECIIPKKAAAPQIRLHLNRPALPQHTIHARAHRSPAIHTQTLCIGASFAVSATNGRDPSRRVHILGFCQSVDYLQVCLRLGLGEKGGRTVLPACGWSSEAHRFKVDMAANRGRRAEEGFAAADPLSAAHISPAHPSFLPSAARPSSLSHQPPPAPAP